MKQKITTFLTFNDQAEHAAKFYTSLFAGSKITSVTRWGKDALLPEGTAMTVEFELAGQRFVALNGGPHFQFAEGISLYVDCETQAEVDHLWSRLTADGGEEQPCGWLKDRWGVSWQVIPRVLIELINHPDAQKAQRATQAMLAMKKIDIAALKRAAAG